MSERLLTAESVVVRYRRRMRPAVNGVSVAISRGDVLGIVGESGSGKSTLARALLGLEQPEQGRVSYRGVDLASMPRGEKERFRRRVQLVFQDPLNSLNPRMTIGATLGEVLAVHRIAVAREIPARVAALLEQVGLGAPVAGRYPHELSGGQRQRVGIARAISMEPEIVIADEPVSALDVSVQAHILNLLKRLVEERGITLVMIAHDLAVVRYVCRDVIVMKDGEVVEQGVASDLLARPRHAYTRSLVAAVPDVEDPARAPWLSSHGPDGPEGPRAPTPPAR